MKLEDQLRIVEKMNAEVVIQLDEHEGSLHLLQKVYRDPMQPLQRRIRCAEKALPFEFPKLAVLATVPANGDFAAALDRAVAASNAARQPRLIEGKVIEPPKGEGSPKVRSAAEVSADHMGKGFQPSRKGFDRRF